MFKDNNVDTVQNKSLFSWMNAALLNFSNLEFHLFVTLMAPYLTMSFLHLRYLLCTL